MTHFINVFSSRYELYYWKLTLNIQYQKKNVTATIDKNT